MIFRFSIFCMLFAFALGGCSSNRPSISAEEARRLSADFETLKFVAPPRRSDTVLDLLRTVKRDPDITMEYAAGYIDKLKIEDDKKRYGSSSVYINLARKGMAYVFIGEYGKAAKTIEKALAVRKKNETNMLWNSYAVVSMSNMIIGNLDVAKKYIDEGSSIEINRAQHSLSGGRRSLFCIFVGDLSCAEKNVDDMKFSLFGLRHDKDSSQLWGQLHWVMAEIDAAKGDYRSAEENILSALDEYDGNRWGEYGYMPYLQVRWADLKNDLGQSVEAEVIGRRALIHLLQTQGKDAPLAGLALAAIARSLLEQGKAKEAEAITKEALEIFSKGGLKDTSILVLRSKALLSALAIVNRDWERAPKLLDDFRRYAIEVKNDPAPIQWPETVDVYLNGIAALIHQGRFSQAKTRLDAILPVARNIYGSKGYASIEARFYTNVLRYLNDPRDVPVADLRADLAGIIEAINSVVGQNGFGVRRRRLEILAEMLTGKAVSNVQLRELAFSLSDLVKSSTVADALAKSQLRVVDGGNKALRDLQDLELKITSLRRALANHLVSSRSTDDEREFETALKARIYDLEEKAGDLRSEVQEQVASANAVGGVGLQRLAKLLRPDELMVKVVVGEQQSFVWTFDRSGNLELNEVALSRDQIGDIVKHLRGELDPRQVNRLSDIPEFDLSAAARLYEALFAPIEDEMKGGRTLVVIADPPLSSLPLAVLPVRQVGPVSDGKPLFGGYKDVPWLLRRNPAMYLPSAYSLVALRSAVESSVKGQSFFGVGDPVFNVAQAEESKQETGKRGSRTRGVGIALRSLPHFSEMRSAKLGTLPRLPDTRDELLSVARSIRSTDDKEILLETKASESNVKKAGLEHFSILHFATHGLVPGDLDGLNETALALSSPEVTGEKNQDGLLTSGEIMELKLNADWVILSACNTASSDSGGEAYSGLGSAFFYAGAKAMMLSNWPVHSGATTELMSRLFKIRSDSRGMTGAQAQQRAMIELLQGPGAVDDSGITLFSYAHPIFWAPFTIVGDGGKVAH